MKAVVLAGGLGSRLATVVPDVPKPMAGIDGKPFLTLVLEYLVEQGIDATTLAVSHGREVIQKHFGDFFGSMALSYSIEEIPLGTGGAIKQAIAPLDEENILIVNGDTIFHVDVNAMLVAHRSSGARLTMAVKFMEECGRYGRVDINDDGIIVSFMEKSANDSGWINGGIYIFNRKFMLDTDMPEKFSLENDLVEPCISQIQPRAFKSDAYFIDIGVPEDYCRAQKEIGVRF